MTSDNLNALRREWRDRKDEAENYSLGSRIASYVGRALIGLSSIGLVAGIYDESTVYMAGAATGYIAAGASHIVKSHCEQYIIPTALAADEASRAYFAHKNR